VTDDEIRLTTQNLAAEQRNWSDVTGGAFTPMLDDWAGINAWTEQRTAIEVVQAILQTVRLENVALSGSKRGEQLAEKTRLVIFFPESASGELRREMEFVMQTEREYVVVCSRGTRARLLNSDDRIVRRLLQAEAGGLPI